MKPTATSANYETQNLWKMFNLDDLFKGQHRMSIIIAALWGWLYNLSLIDIRTFTLEFLVKGFAGIFIAVITAFAVVLTKDFYAIKIKPRIFKNKTNKKQ